MKLRTALTIAGSDSGGGAGIQADLKTFSALGVYGASVITALTAQNTQSVNGILVVPPDFIRQQIDAVCGDIGIDALKIGMLSRPDVIEVVADAIDRHGLAPVVLDPVMVAKSGDRLLAPEAVDALRDNLLPRATVITPNLPEAAVLLDRNLTSAEDMPEAAARLLDLGPGAVLLKGGHLEGRISVDVFHDGTEALRLESPRIDTRNTHGTGCTLSAAIAAYLARGQTLADAVCHAKEYVTAAIRAAKDLDLGGGHGPVHHFHAVWSRP